MPEIRFGDARRYNDIMRYNEPSFVNQPADWLIDEVPDVKETVISIEETIKELDEITK